MIRGYTAKRKGGFRILNQLRQNLSHFSTPFTARMGDLKTLK